MRWFLRIALATAIQGAAIIGWSIITADRRLVEAQPPLDADLQQPEVRVRAEMDLIVKSSPDFQFANHVAVSAGGQIVLFNNRAGSLQMLDSSGRRQWVVNGAGRGESVLDMKIVNDTIVVLDENGHRQRLRFLNLKGQQLSARSAAQLEIPIDRSDRTTILQIGRLGNRWVSLHRRTLQAAGPSPWSRLPFPEWELRPLAPDGRRWTPPIWKWTDSTEVERVRVGPGEMSVRSLFAPNASIVIRHDGLWFARGADSGIDVFDANGNSLRVIRSQVERTPIEQQVRSRAIQASLAQDMFEWGPDTAMAKLSRAAVEPVVTRLTQEQYAPVVGGIWLARNGRIAVTRRDLALSAGDSVVVDILAPSGKLIRRTTLPPNVFIRQFNGTHLFAIPRQRPGRGMVGERAPLLVRYRVE